MNQYEQREYESILSWKKEEPSVVTKAIGFVFKPASWLIEKVVPQKAIEGCLIAFDKIAEFLTDTADIVRDGSVSNVEELQTKSLKMSDGLADNVHNWALATAGVEGAVSGSTGLPGIMVDIPALITISLRTVHKIGVCYGFEVKTEADRQRVFWILAAASANTMAEKSSALCSLQKISVYVAKNTWKKIIEDAGKGKWIAKLVVAIKQLATQLGINLTKRKVAQIIPVVGSGVGAAVNVAFINDVVWAARRTYQELWLERNNKIKPTLRR